MEDTGNIVTSASNNVPKFDKIRPLSYREWYSKIHVILPLSNKDAFDEMNRASEPSPIYLEDTTAGQQTTADNANNTRR